jgi:hypothetical protein
MKRILALSSVLAMAATAALAQEAMATRPADSPAPPPAAPVADLDRAPSEQDQAAEWARRVLARANGQLPPTDERAVAMAEAGISPEDAKRGCVRNPDRSPHGEVTASVGSRGYRGVGGVVTQPVGDCGQVTIGISTSQGGGRFFGPGYYGGGYYGRGWR